jgi:hypothetical protein
VEIKMAVNNWKFTLGSLMLVGALSFSGQAYALSSGWQPPGWVDTTNPGPPMPKPERTPGDNPKINPTGDPDVRKGANDYCKTHRGGVCG